MTVRMKIISCSFLLVILTLVLLPARCEIGATGESPVAGPDSANSSANGSSSNSTEHEEQEGVSISVAKIDFDNVRGPYTIALVILISALVKLAFHSSEKLSSHVPESCLLIVFGFAIGGLISLSEETSRSLQFTPNIFFFFLLPPIVFEAGYLMHKRYFFSNIGTILMYAVVGTLWNTFAVALSLFALSELGGVTINNPLSFVDCFLMGTIIAAVDPVAVIAIFDEVHVNLLLYILVFGESLVNDAVSVTLYRTAETFVEFEANNQTIPGSQIGLAVVSFFTISFGGLFTGIVWGIFASFITRFTDHVRVIETLLVFVCGYMSYLTAEIFHFSGIMSAIAAGVVMRHYLNLNVSQKSRTTIKYCLKMLSSAAETITFMFLGFASVQSSYEFDAGLVFGTIIFALVFRFIGVFGLTWIVNRFRVQQITYLDQFILGYGGLRGAVSFSLVLLLDNDDVPQRSAIFTAILALIIFTVFIQGTTVKPLVKRLHVSTYQPQKSSINVQLHNTMMDHISAGINDIVGQHNDYYFAELFVFYDNKYIKPILQRSNQEINDTILQRLEKHFHSTTSHRQLYDIRSRRTQSEECHRPLCPSDSAQRHDMPLRTRDEVQSGVGEILAPSKALTIHDHVRHNVADRFDDVRLRLMRLHMLQDHPHHQPAHIWRPSSTQDLGCSHSEERREALKRRRCCSESHGEHRYRHDDELTEASAARWSTLSSPCEIRHFNSPSTTTPVASELRGSSFSRETASSFHTCASGETTGAAATGPRVRFNTHATGHQSTIESSV